MSLFRNFRPCRAPGKSSTMDPSHPAWKAYRRSGHKSVNLGDPRRLNLGRITEQKLGSPFLISASHHVLSWVCPWNTMNSDRFRIWIWYDLIWFVRFSPPQIWRTLSDRLSSHFTTEIMVLRTGASDFSRNLFAWETGYPILCHAETQTTPIQAWFLPQGLDYHH